MLKKIIFGLFVLFFISCTEENLDSGQMTDYLPEQSAFILQLQNPDLFFSNLKNNEFIKQNSDYSGFSAISKNVAVLKYFQKSAPALLAFVNTDQDSLHFLYISKGELQTSALDSVRNKSVETEKSDTEVKRYNLEGNIAFSASRNGISLISNSRDLLGKSLKNGELLNNVEEFEKVFKAASSKKPAIFINHQKVKQPGLEQLFSDLNFSDFSSWTVLDIDISQEALKLNGISVPNDSVPALLSAFENTAASENEIAHITPLDAVSFSSFTFDSFARFRDNLTTLQHKQKDSLVLSEEVKILKDAVEIGKIDLDQGFAIAVRSQEPDGNSYIVEPEASLLENFREIDIFEYPKDKGFINIFQPLLSFEEQRYFGFLEPFFIFSEDPEVIKSIITAVKNEQVLAESAAFQNTATNLSSESSILIVTKNKDLKNVNSEGDLGNLNFEDYPLSAFQAVYQKDFAHIHAVLSKNSEVKSEARVIQSSAVQLDAGLAGQPVFFKNHRTNGMDVAVQDLSNTLSLISPSGKIYWKKTLNSRILGEIQTVDILKNGRYQLAFATQNKLHVIDREGNPVKPFPLDFKDLITQPLAVFDYDNNRDYRFVVVQGKDVYMYDRKGRTVKGFNFNKAKSEILVPPKHIRLGRKDYILIADASEKLNILSRTGKVRVPVNNKINFSRNEWYEYNGNFVSLDDSGRVIKVDENGNIKKEELGFSENTQLVATEKSLVTLSENELTIKGKSLSLDFGLYTAPQIFYLNNKIYVSTTDLQSHKVYLLDSNAELIPGFPVFGNSAIDLANADADAALELTVKGDDDTVLLYEVN